MMVMMCLSGGGDDGDVCQVVMMMVMCLSGGDDDDSEVSVRW